MYLSVTYPISVLCRFFVIDNTDIVIAQKVEKSQNEQNNKKDEKQMIAKGKCVEKSVEKYDHIYTMAKKHKRETEKTEIANKTNYTQTWYAFYYLRPGNEVGPILTGPEPTWD